MTSEDITQIGALLDDRFTKFEEKLDKKFDEKFEQYLTPINEDLIRIETKVDTSINRLDKVESRLGKVEVKLEKVESRLSGVEGKLNKALYTDNVHLEKRVTKLEEHTGLKPKPAQ